MRDSTKTSSTALREDRARPPVAAAHKPAELPIVIRPRPLPLARLEELLRRDRSLARLLANEPMHLNALATAVLRHDRAAQARFADADQLVRHLQGRLRSPSVSLQPPQ